MYIAGYLNVRKMSEMLVFRTFVGARSLVTASGKVVVLVNYHFISSLTDIE